MIRLASAEDCRARVGILGGWFGAPPVWKGMGQEIELIDGKLRAAVLGPMNLPPGIGVDTPREIVRVLCAAGEYERARDCVPANIAPNMIAAWAGIPLDWVALMQLRPKACRSHPESIDRIEVVRRVRRLLEVADAGESVTATDLRWALGRFADYCRRGRLEKR
jgi:hypothetical protein